MKRLICVSIYVSLCFLVACGDGAFNTPLLSSLSNKNGFVDEQWIVIARENGKIIGRGFSDSVPEGTQISTDGSGILATATKKGTFKFELLDEGLPSIDFHFSYGDQAKVIHWKIREIKTAKSTIAQRPISLPNPPKSMHCLNQLNCNSVIMALGPNDQFVQIDFDENTGRPFPPIYLKGRHNIPPQDEPSNAILDNAPEFAEILAQYKTKPQIAKISTSLVVITNFQKDRLDIYDTYSKTLNPWPFENGIVIKQLEEGGNPSGASNFVINPAAKSPLDILVMMRLSSELVPLDLSTLFGPKPKANS